MAKIMHTWIAMYSIFHEISSKVLSTGEMATRMEVTAFAQPLVDNMADNNQCKGR
jgi:hypothetical protein